MANTVVFNQTDVNKNPLRFEDLEIGDIFVYSSPEDDYCFMKVEESMTINGYAFNAICIEDPDLDYIAKDQKVKKFVGEIALNGTFVEN